MYLHGLNIVKISDVSMARSQCASTVNEIARQLDLKICCYFAFCFNLCVILSAFGVQALLVGKIDAGRR